MRNSVLGLAMALFVFPACGGVEPIDEVGSHSSALFGYPGEYKRDLAAVRKATKKYNHLSAALADGFVPEICRDGQGWHYIHPERFYNPAIDRDQPEILQYAPNEEGRLKLVAVEYFQFVSDPIGPAPVLFNQAFVGPLTIPGLGTFYALTVWAWDKNDAGLFSFSNPDLAGVCDWPVDLDDD